MNSKKYLLRLRSSDGEVLNPNTFHGGDPNRVKNLGNEVCDVRFRQTALNLYSLLGGHPNGKFNVRVSYFNLYSPKGIRVQDDMSKIESPVINLVNDTVMDIEGAKRKCAGIDIICDEFNSPFVASSNPQHGTVLATAGAKIAQATDETNGAGGTDPGKNIEPIAFTLTDEMTCAKTCNFTKDGFLHIRLRDSAVSNNGRFSQLVSYNEDQEVVAMPNFVLELEFTPYYENDHREYPKRSN